MVTTFALGRSGRAPAISDTIITTIVGRNVEELVLKGLTEDKETLGKCQVFSIKLRVFVQWEKENSQL